MTALCSTTSRGHDETITATASRVERWLLVEHRGAWGPETVPSGRMPRPLSRALAKSANDARARLVLIRRPHPPRRRTGPAPFENETGRWIFTVDSRPGGEQVLARHVSDDAELLALVDGGLPYARVPEGAQLADGWQVLDERLWLVCTHGRHDRCCAVRGRPVAQNLLARHPDTTWECTHVGGDRFAANVVVLPEGLYLGRVEPDEVVTIADDLVAGTLPAERVRGRSSLSLPAQAAQQFAREATGRWGTSDLLPVEQGPAGPDQWRIVLGSADNQSGSAAADLAVTVRYDRSGDGEARLLTCGAAEDKTAPVFRLVSLYGDPATA